jgi:hypothetical protein
MFGTNALIRVCNALEVLAPALAGMNRPLSRRYLGRDSVPFTGMNQWDQNGPVNAIPRTRGDGPETISGAPDTRRHRVPVAARGDTGELGGFCLARGHLHYAQ